MLQDVTVHVDREEIADDTTGSGRLYTYGESDIWIQGTFVLTTPELSSLDVLRERDSNGDMTETAYKVVAKNISGSTRTMTINGILKLYEVSKTRASGEKVKIPFFIRSTDDDITIA